MRPKKGESAELTRHPLLEFNESGRQPLNRQIPQLPVKRDVPPDGADGARPGQPAGDRPSAQAAAKQVLPAAVVDVPEVIADIF